MDHSSASGRGLAGPPPVAFPDAGLARWRPLSYHLPKRPISTVAQRSCSICVAVCFRSQPRAWFDNSVTESKQLTNCFIT
jgi:hypothetical protein